MASTSIAGGTPGARRDGDGDGDRAEEEAAAAAGGDHAESEPAGAALEGRSLQDARTRAGERGWRRERRSARPLTPRSGMAPLDRREPGSLAGTSRDPGVDRTVPEGTRAHARAGVIAATRGRAGNGRGQRRARGASRQPSSATASDLATDRVSDRRKSGTAIVKRRTTRVESGPRVDRARTCAEGHHETARRPVSIERGGERETRRWRTPGASRYLPRADRLPQNITPDFPIARALDRPMARDPNVRSESHSFGELPRRRSRIPRRLRRRI